MSTAAAIAPDGAARDEAATLQPAQEPARPRVRLVHDALPWLTSLCVNLAFTLVLALIALPLVSRGTIQELILSQAVEETGEEITSLDVTLAEVDESAPRLADQVVTVLEQQVQLHDQSAVDSASQVTESIVDPESSLPLLPPRGVLNMPLSAAAAPRPLTESELRQAATVEEAVDGVAGQIRSMLGEGDVLVVWLLDSSLSLVDDRQRIANRLLQVYSDIGQELQDRAKLTGQKTARLTNAVVAYGAIQAEVVSAQSVCRPGRQRHPRHPARSDRRGKRDDRGRASAPCATAAR